MNELMTFGAFVLGIGILMSVINLLISMRSGAIGWERILGTRMVWSGRPIRRPKPYATSHIPTVITRHPLWDDHDEEADPNDDRLLDEARLTLTTTWLDARPLSVATMPGETLLPLCFSLTMFVLFIALIFQMMWLALAALHCNLPDRMLLDVADSP